MLHPYAQLHSHVLLSFPRTLCSGNLDFAGQMVWIAHLVPDLRVVRNSSRPWSLPLLEASVWYVVRLGHSHDRGHDKIIEYYLHVLTKYEYMRD